MITSNGFGWYENNGQQSFTYRTNSLTGISLRTPFDLADVDGDGDLDVFSASSGSSSYQLTVLINDGQQRFAAQPALLTPAYPVSAIRASDVDRDGDVDFAVSFEYNASNGAVGWYENVAGAWTFHDLTTVAGQLPRAARDVVPIDFDFDGDIDLVATTVPNPMALELFRNDGNQVFARETLASGVAGAHAITPLVGERLQVADVDGDGDYDVVAGTNNSVRLYRNEGSAGFTQANILQESPGSSMPVAVGDLDGDGKLEIIASIGLSSVVRLDDRPFGDYDRNGTVDQADRDLYEATLGQPAVPPGSGADGDRSGVVDAADLALWEANFGAGMIPPVRPADLNQDERIDGADFLDWQRSFGATTTYPGMHRADLDFSATVDDGDLDVWKRHYGQGVAPPATAAAVAALSASSATASVTAVPIASPALESASATPSTSSPSSLPALRLALPASVVLAFPAEKPVSKKADALHLLKRNSTSLRDAAFAALSSPWSNPLPRQRLLAQPPQSIASSDEAHAELDAALSDECLLAVLDR